MKVEGGWVTLSGEVEWQYQKQAAADAVRYLAGVKGISDLVSIKPKAKTSVVKADIEAALKRQATQDAKDITVRVDGSKVTLTGSIHSFAERELATNTAWGAPGVHSVVDEMTFAA